MGTKKGSPAARGCTQYAPHPRTHVDSRMENGKNRRRQNTNNTPVGDSDAKKNAGPIVLVLLGIGCASPVIWIMLWRKLQQCKPTYLIQWIDFYDFLALFDVS